MWQRENSYVPPDTLRYYFHPEWCGGLVSRINELAWLIRTFVETSDATGFCLGNQL